MAKQLWSPSQTDVASSNMQAFMFKVNTDFNQQFETYEELWQWSVKHIADF